MSHVHRDIFDPKQPALLVQQGNTPRKWRSIKNDVVIIGRSHGCDIELTSEQIGPVHCILAHVRRGWLLRDCGSLVGTYVNGQRIEEAYLTHGDQIQLGIFGFTTHFPDDTPLPADAAPAQPDQRRERSRRKLIKLALSLRRKLRARQGKASSPVPSDIAQQAKVLDERKREYELRVCQLEKAERELAIDRDEVAEGHARLKDLKDKVESAERDLAQRKAEVEEKAQRAERDLAQRLAKAEEKLKQAQGKLSQRKTDAEEKLKRAARELGRRKKETEDKAEHFEGELAQRKAEVDAEIAKAWEAFRSRCAEFEQAVSEPPGPAVDEEALRLDLRRRELDHFAAHLDRTRRRLHDRELELAVERARLAQQRTAALQAERQHRRKNETGPSRKPVLLAP
jgi:tetrahydromethanopterin S-methyltransferase subunit G